MDHPDFRVNGRIFATLHHDLEWGMVTLTPEQQADFMRAHPRAFVPEKGAWGRRGCTAVRLALVDEDAAGEALTLACRNKSAVKPARAAGFPRAVIAAIDASQILGV